MTETAVGRGRPAAGDLTARARIREAARALFAERGVAGTTIRDVARRADVSSGLVQHHFRTKDALRKTCDDHVLGEIIRLKEALVLEGKIDNPAFLADAHPEILGLYRYLARSVIDGSPAARAMFDQMVGATETWIDKHRPGIVDDVHAYAALLVAMETGLLAMHGPLSSALGIDVLSDEGHRRLSRAKVAFYSTPLLEPEPAAHMRASIDAVLTSRDPGRDEGSAQ
jgi:TetR/AcrR family transcriptional regulator, regulator of cefoperazone and chloramphenicol sensitivity